MINPFKHEYDATFLKKDGEEAVVEIKSGAVNERLRIPVGLIPDEIKPGESFSLRFQSKETAQTGTYESMRKLLEELIQ